MAKPPEGLPLWHAPGGYAMRQLLGTANAIVPSSKKVGGVGARLHPLTQDRAKPAVPFGGKYRIIDFTLSNCYHSGLRRILVLTQYKSHSLQLHLRDGWSFACNWSARIAARANPKQGWVSSRNRHSDRAAANSPKICHLESHRQINLIFRCLMFLNYYRPSVSG